MDTKGKIREFMLNEFRESGFHAGLGDGASLVESGILDSLSILKLICFMDEQFGVVLNEDELNPEKLNSIEAIAAFIERKRG